jgi:hypothetical protein
MTLLPVDLYLRSRTCIGKLVRQYQRHTERRGGLHRHPVTTLVCSCQEVGVLTETPPPNPRRLGSPMYCTANPRHLIIWMKTDRGGGVGDLRAADNHQTTNLDTALLLAAT